ncbi:MAG: SDR family oxidoreductase [Deltaproteobacteria bacterium]|nr:SDR family oxidoreductase [Deltaproteobacteria bacterium]
MKGSWALVLGASSGFGAATALALARKGMNIVGVHLDRKGTMPAVNALVAKLEATGVAVHFFNMNAADEGNRGEILDSMGELMGKGEKVRVLLHSLAFGNLRPFIGEPAGEGINRPQLEMTLDAMAHTLVYWVQDVVARGYFARNSRIFAMTSSGSKRVWKTYGAVSAAKAALESHIRQLALELAPLGITANAVLAGVTDTPALRKIPGNEAMIELAKAKNPAGRLTTPEDVAEAIAVFSEPGTYWMTGSILRVDGGEDIAG